jgi:HYR domain
MKARVLKSIVLATAFSLALPTQPAGAVSFVDEEQPLIDATIGALAIGWGSEQKLAQVVTVGHAGALRAVDLAVGCDSQSDLTLEIQGVGTDGQPDGVLMTSPQDIDGTLLTSAFQFTRIELDQWVDVAAGQRLAIVLLSGDPGCASSHGPAGDLYTEGDGWFDARPNAPGWVCMCEFAGSAFDLPFRTWVEDTIPPELAVPGTITVDATSPAGAYVEVVATATDDRDGTLPASCNPGAGTFPIGTTRVTCTARDDSGNEATANFDVVVRGGPEQIGDLASAIQDMVLPGGTTTALNTKLQEAEDAIAAGDIATACGDLGAFINQVDAQADKKRLTRAQADQLTAEAQRIRQVLGC